MFNFPKKKTDISTEVLVNTIWVSSFLGNDFYIAPIRIISRDLSLDWNLIVGAVDWFWSSFCYSGIFR